MTVFERDEAPGGLMRFGVPDAKLEKWMIDRRVDVLAAEGIRFEYNADIGGSGMGVEDLRDRFNAVVVATGSRVARTLEVPGSDLAGVHDAMDYLYIRNRYVASISGGPEGPEPAVPIVAKDKDVVVIGGGDTGMDCISNANREGARSTLLLDVYPEVPEDGRYADTPWPLPLKRSATTYALDEGGERRFGHQVIELKGDSEGNVAELLGRKVTGSSSRTSSRSRAPSTRCPPSSCWSRSASPAPSARASSTAWASSSTTAATSTPPPTRRAENGIFAAGDARVGQSLIVTAIAEGRRCARIVDRFLKDADPVTAVDLPIVRS